MNYITRLNFTDASRILMNLADRYVAAASFDTDRAPDVTKRNIEKRCAQMMRRATRAGIIG